MHSSNCIWMSAPSRHWISIERSGEIVCREPSMWDWNVTPSLVILRIFDRLMTWKPPLSVRIGPFQPMNLCRPPRRATRSAPGRSIRW